MTLERIIYYPIKSLRGIEVGSHQATPMGLQWDRRWMLIEDDGSFVSQRKDPKLAQLLVEKTSNGWLVSAPEGHAVTVPFECQTGSGVGVEVWGDQFEAIHGPSHADGFFSSFLGRPVRLVYHHNPTGRPVDPRYSRVTHMLFLQMAIRIWSSVRPVSGFVNLNLLRKRWIGGVFAPIWLSHPNSHLKRILGRQYKSERRYSSWSNPAPDVS